MLYTRAEILSEYDGKFKMMEIFNTLNNEVLFKIVKDFDALTGIYNEIDGSIYNFFSEYYKKKSDYRGFSDVYELIGIIEEEKLKPSGVDESEFVSKANSFLKPKDFTINIKNISNDNPLVKTNKSYVSNTEGDKENNSYFLTRYWFNIKDKIIKFVIDINMGSGEIKNIFISDLIYDTVDPKKKYYFKITNYKTLNKDTLDIEYLDSEFKIIKKNAEDKYFIDIDYENLYKYLIDNNKLEYTNFFYNNDEVEIGNKNKKECYIEKPVQFVYYKINQDVLIDSNSERNPTNNNIINKLFILESIDNDYLEKPKIFFHYIKNIIYYKFEYTNHFSEYINNFNNLYNDINKPEITIMSDDVLNRLERARTGVNSAIEVIDEDSIPITINKERTIRYTILNNVSTLYVDF